MQKMLIGGHLVGAEQWVEVLDPYTQQALDHVARGGASHVDQAVQLARLGAQEMRSLSLAQRAHILKQVAHLIRQERNALASLLVQETGKLIHEARIEVERACMVYELAAEACHHPRATQFPPESFTDGASRFGFWAREPLGVVSAILAFNLPLAHAAQKTAPAIAAGNAVILKPSREAPLTVLRLGLLLHRAGMPPEALSILTGVGEEIGRALAAHPDVNLLTFIGSREVGVHLSAEAGSKRIELELESFSVLLMTESAPAEEVAVAIVRCGFMMGGQSASAIQHVWAPASRLNALMEHLLPLVEALKPGSPMEEETTLAPLINPHAVERVAAWVQEAVDGGAQVLTGGRAEPPFYMPTLLTGLPEGCRLYREAVFGPVVAIHAYDDLSATIKMLNALLTPYRLAVYTQNLAEAFEIARHANALSVHINDFPVLPIDPVIRGDMQEHHLCFEDMLQRIERMSRPKYVGFGAMRLLES